MKYDAYVFTCWNSPAWREGLDTFKGDCSNCCGCGEDCPNCDGQIVLAQSELDVVLNSSKGYCYELAK